ncbi:MAG: DUF2167 domain-containing protein [Myxococcales bacterium FL481]|nr:MAG: DUF2167 domain-containing protein [Myxococcales bacterium FL481]
MPAALASLRPGSLSPICSFSVNTVLPLCNYADAIQPAGRFRMSSRGSTALAAVVFLAPVVSVHAAGGPSTTSQAAGTGQANVQPTAPDEDAEGTAEAAATEPDDGTQRTLAELSDAGRLLVRELGSAGLDALIDKANAGGELTPDELEVVVAIRRMQIRAFIAELPSLSGDVTLDDGVATLHLGNAYRFYAPEQAEKILVDVWNNPPGRAGRGILVPTDVDLASPDGWAVVLEFAEDGYIDDEDADDIDYNDLLASIQSTDEPENKQRSKQGYPAIFTVDWAEPPHYDKDKHALYWALHLAPDPEGSDPDKSSLNYMIRVLGRRGVLELNAVAELRQLPDIRPRMEEVYKLVEFEPGHRYADFDPDLDKVAAYGLGGLIAGKLAMKTGLFAIILKGLLAAKKALLVGGLALLAAIRTLLRRRKGAVANDVETSSDATEDQPNGQSQSDPRRASTKLRAQHLMLPRIMWGGNIAALFFFGSQAYAQTKGATTEEIPEAMLVTFICIAVAAIVGSWWFPPFLVKRTGSWPLPRFTRNPQALEQAMRNVGPGGDPLLAGVQACVTSYIIRLACLESVAVFGLLLTFMAGDLGYYLAFATVALLNLIFARFPKRTIEETWYRILREGAASPAAEAGSA